MSLDRVAIVGSGIAGLACAMRLQAAGVEARVFDKGLVPGGRMGSRRFAGAKFDHGAQFMAARSDDFRAALEGWGAAGNAAIWPAASDAQTARWVGVPSMAALSAQIAAQLAARPAQARHVGTLIRMEEGWLLRHHAAAAMAPGAVSSQGGELAGPFDAVVVAIPAPQAAALIATTGHDFAERAGEARYEPCWAVLAAFSGPVELPDAQRSDTGRIAWLARESSRPGRETGERFVFHASADYSRRLLEERRPYARAAVLESLALHRQPTAALAHRWRYARVERALDEPCLWDPAWRLGACGDWCLGGRIEAAWDSGRAMAAAMLDGR